MTDRLRLTLTLLLAGPSPVLWAAPCAVFIVAGQSNALNWHAAAHAMPASAADASILFYFETGAPPDREFAVPFNATSNGQWTRLGAQRQEPFMRYERDFFGPEISLARRLRQHDSSRQEKYAIIKVAYFGTSLAHDWHPDAATGNRLYARLCEHINEGCAQLQRQGYNPRPAGFFWMQGETDGADARAASAYAQNLRTFIRRLRADLKTDALPFVLGRIGPPTPRGHAHQELVRTAQAEVGAATPHVAWVDTDDLPRDTDGVHLLAPGVLRLGERMAEAWLRIRPRPASP
jgi:hypothetical protein